MSIVDKCVESYSRLKHLKLVGEEVGIPWQTVYAHLRTAGVPVCGDKARYGSITDKFAAKAERMFHQLVPYAIDNNKTEFQSTIDFTVNGIEVDIKAAKKTLTKWGYCINKQRDNADVFVLYAFDEFGDNVEHIFMIPSEIATQKTTISIPVSLKSKWSDYAISEDGIKEFFDMLK